MPAVPHEGPVGLRHLPIGADHRLSGDEPDALLVVLRAGEVAGVEVKYRTIVADPPWDYPKGFAKTTGNPEVRRGRQAALPYGSMSIDEIKALPVCDLADIDAWLWLWTTNRYLRDAFDVAEAWGFTYRQTVVWHKNDGHPRFPATIAPNRAEYVLVCRKGNAQRVGVLPSNVISVPFDPNTMRHSQKPEAFIDHIEAVCPGPYLEMFARRQRIGWDTWGTECFSVREANATSG